MIQRITLSTFIFPALLTVLHDGFGKCYGLSKTLSRFGLILGGNYGRHVRKLTGESIIFECSVNNVLSNGARCTINERVVFNLGPHSWFRIQKQ